MAMLADLPAELAERGAQGRVLSVGQRPRVVEMALSGDRAGASGATMGPGALDGVFNFGGEEEVNFQRAQTAKNAEDKRVQVLGLIKSADAHVQVGRLQEAAKDVEAAQDINQELRFDEGRALAMVMVAKIYAKQGVLSTFDQLDEADDLASEAQEKFQKCGSKKCEAAALLALASARYGLKKFDSGMLAAKEAQLILQEARDRSAEAQVYHTVVDGFALKGEFKKAVKFMNKGRAIYEEMGDKKSEAACVHRVGQIEIQANNKDGALKALSAARRLYIEARDSKGEVATLNTLREFHVAKGCIGEAVDVCKEIVTLYHNAGDTKGEGSALIRLAELLMEKGHMDLAAKVLAAAQKVFSSVRDSDGMAKVGDFYNRWKNENLKTEIKRSIEDNRDYANYPDQPYIEFGLTKIVRSSYNDTTKLGL